MKEIMKKMEYINLVIFTYCIAMVIISIMNQSWEDEISWLLYAILIRLYTRTHEKLN
jgi:c-di-AMP phosphodiesterase-like protein